MQSGDAVDAYGEALAAGTVCIIVETAGKCRNGELGFTVSYD